MLERIVENWLTNATERSYQGPFTQLLVSEGYRVLHGPVHHPFEHGKDIVGLDGTHQLHAFQLKAGDIGLTDLESIQQQLFALCATAVTYPGVEPPRPPDRTFLVTNGSLTPPARDRLRSFNDANRQRGLPPIEAVEREQLLSRFIAVHGSYLPHELSNLNELLSFVLSTGVDQFPVTEFSELLRGIVRTAGAAPSQGIAHRALASSTLLTAYVAGPWERVNNFLGVAEAWLCLVATILSTAEEIEPDSPVWDTSLLLARDGARTALAQLLEEAAGREDLIIPGIVEGLVYSSRAALVCGYCAAFYLSERELDAHDTLSTPVKELLLRECDSVKIAGEAAVPHLLMIATALELLNEPIRAARIVTQWAAGIAKANHPESQEALPDPYHSISSVLLHSLGQESELDEEDFAGESHTLHIALDWLARRDYRPIVEKLWPAVTRIHFAEFRPSRPSCVLKHEDPDGQQMVWAPAPTKSWAALRSEASILREDALPIALWRNSFFLPYLSLLYPYRLTGSLAKAIDYIGKGFCRISFPEEGESTPILADDSVN